MSIIKKIQVYYKNKIPTLFTTPSHNQGKFIIPILKKMLGKKYFQADFSEIEGFDNLRNPKNTLKNTQEKIAKIYNSKHTFMLTNGSTSGIIATMQALLSKDDEVLIARNCHISVYNGLVITGAKPIWVYPTYNPEWGIYGEITPNSIEKELNLHPNIKSVIITSPTYEGIYSDIQAISEICRNKQIPLIVDEAHGALLNFANLGQKPAIKLGADISIQSLHKTTGAPNPCALLHVAKDSNIPPEIIQESLNLFNTTSPSYPLLVAIEGTVDYLNSANGRKHIERLLNDISKLKNNLPGNVKVYDTNNDKTKLLIRFDNQNNIQLAEILNEKYKIEEEFSTHESMLFLTGIGTTSKKMATLSKIIKKLCKIQTNKDTACKKQPEKTEIVFTPMEAYKKQFQYIEKNDAMGKICAEIIINYPPGIPLLLPGEKITNENVEFIDKDKIKVIE